MSFYKNWDKALLRCLQTKNEYINFNFKIILYNCIIIFCENYYFQKLFNF